MIFKTCSISHRVILGYASQCFYKRSCFPYIKVTLRCCGNAWSHHISWSSNLISALNSFHLTQVCCIQDVAVTWDVYSSGDFPQLNRRNSKPTVDKSPADNPPVHPCLNSSLHQGNSVWNRIRYDSSKDIHHLLSAWCLIYPNPHPLSLPWSRLQNWVEKGLHTNPIFNLFPLSVPPALSGEITGPPEWYYHI